MGACKDHWTRCRNPGDLRNGQSSWKEDSQQSYSSHELKYLLINLIMREWDFVILLGRCRERIECPDYQNN